MTQFFIRARGFLLHDTGLSTSIRSIWILLEKREAPRSKRGDGKISSPCYAMDVSIPRSISVGIRLSTSLGGGIISVLSHGLNSVSMLILH